MEDSLHDQQFTGLETLTPERKSSASSTGSAAALKFPRDMDGASEDGAACGHFAFAASHGLLVRDVFHYFPGLREGKSWCSVRTIEQALNATGKPWRSVGAGWPVWGLVIVQALGPWMKPGVPFGARLSRTHWIATADNGALIADANADSWLPRSDWEKLVLEHMLVRWRAEGWEVKRGYEVTQNAQVNGGTSVPPTC